METFVEEIVGAPTRESCSELNTPETGSVPSSWRHQSSSV